MELEEIRARLDVLTKAAKARMSACSPDFSGVVGGAEIDFMTPEERQERFELLRRLPTTGEEILAAQARIKVRVAARKAKRLARLTVSAA